MLEALDLDRKLPKPAYKQSILPLQLRLHALQRACWQCRVATIVVVEGWSAAGKGSVIRKLTQRLEPRGFELHAVRAARTYELHLPWMWRFWVKVPSWGEIAIFDRSWYRRVLLERVEGLVDEPQWRQAYRDIVSFERLLADDRYSIVKFFLHLSKKEQGRRLEELREDPRTSWRVEERDLRSHELYDEHLVAVEEMLAQTESEWGPWTLVEATDERWARVKVIETLIRRMEAALESQGCVMPEEEPPVQAEAGGVGQGGGGARLLSPPGHDPEGGEGPQGGAERVGVKCEEAGGLEAGGDEEADPEQGEAHPEKAVVR